MPSVELQIPLAQYLGEPHVAGMVRVAQIRAKHGDGYFLVRQLALHEATKDQCPCSENTCGGCVGLTWVIAELERLTEKQRREDPLGCEREMVNARGHKQPEQQSLLPASTDADARYP